MGMDLQFKIIEGQHRRLCAEDFDEFKNDYLHSRLTSNEVRLKWGLSKKEYSDVTKEIREDKGISCRPFTRAKHFYRHGNRWYIFKTNKKERIYIGSLPCSQFSESVMYKIVEKLKLMEWNIDECTDFLLSLGDGIV